jgi:RHS repeat-associated protein
VQYVWSPVYVDALVLRDRDSNGDGTLDERLYVAQDGNYDVTALFDNAGNVVERYIYDPFGQATILDASWNVLAASAFAWVYLHQGGRFDTTSGLYYFRNRDYSPTLGRWTSLDPLRYEAGDVNLYRALGNSPINTVDPTGLDFWDWLANDVIGTDNVRSWDSVLGHHRTGWFAQGSNFFAGWGDTLSFGLTSYARQGLGYDDVVDYDSGAYFGGQVVGTVHGIAMMGANGYANVGAQWRATGSFWRGMGRYFYDSRSWSTVSRDWTRWWGASRRVGPHLHHAIFPQRWTWIPQGLRNAGFNYMPMSRWLNSGVLNMFPRLGRPFEWVWRFGYITQFNPLVNPFLGRYPGSYYDWANGPVAGAGISRRCGHRGSIDVLL